jgi:uncharacterized protein YoaH (UPF0181 family)
MEGERERGSEGARELGSEGMASGRATQQVIEASENERERERLCK